MPSRYLPGFGNTRGDTLTYVAFSWQLTALLHLGASAYTGWRNTTRPLHFTAPMHDLLCDNHGWANWHSYAHALHVQHLLGRGLESVAMPGHSRGTPFNYRGTESTETESTACSCLPQETCGSRTRSNPPACRGGKRRHTAANCLRQLCILTRSMQTPGVFTAPKARNHDVQVSGTTSTMCICHDASQL